MRNEITIVDSGMGNLQSVRRKLERVGARAVVSSDPAALAAAQKLVIPGVGHFQRAMANLRERRLIDALEEAVLRRKVPVLGICLGLQLMARRSEEGEVAGLGWLVADVVRFRVGDSARHKVPHMGWNGLHAARPSPLLEGIASDAEFYFCHSYHLRFDDRADVLGETDYDYRFDAAAARGHIYGVQFHPEKSHDAGERLLRNFAEL
jgi:glutamine amidotransferase